MTTTQTTYRKTKQGEWVAYGPAAILGTGPGTVVNVRTKSGGIKTEHIARCGRPFSVDGQQMVYGYIAPRSPRSSAAPRRRPSYQDRLDACKSDTGDCWTFGVRGCLSCGS